MNKLEELLYSASLKDLYCIIKNIEKIIDLRKSSIDCFGEMMGGGVVFSTSKNIDEEPPCAQ